MGKFISNFNTTAELVTFSATTNFGTPHVSLTKDDSKVHYFDPYNGHDYVDLGLPSGTKWATMNVGASQPSDYGLFFQWGDTQGYTADQVGSASGKKFFGWADYKYNPSGDGSTMSKYNTTDGKTVLDLEDDAARANWGGSWKMPTETQLQELLNTANCTNTWTTVNGVNGRLFTSVRNGNTLFIPAASSAQSGVVQPVGTLGYVWSSSLVSSYVINGHSLVFSSRSASVKGDTRRYYGFAVRPVIG